MRRILLNQQDAHFVCDLTALSENNANFGGSFLMLVSLHSKACVCPNANLFKQLSKRMFLPHFDIRESDSLLLAMIISVFFCYCVTLSMLTKLRAYTC